MPSAILDWDRRPSQKRPSECCYRGCQARTDAYVAVMAERKPEHGQSGRGPRAGSLQAPFCREHAELVYGKLIATLSGYDKRPRVGGES